ncbi:MAG: YafY family transcriptional regulator [Spirochaetales bacterium]|nr:YafY family transcriptional regulator [Spirochaetales bacterium]
MRIDRMISIIILLLNRETVTAHELSRRFEVSVRTIYRDIDAINLAGVPVISFQGNRGGFGIMENYKLNHQLLTLKDMCSLLTTLKGINSTLEDRELGRAIEKIRSLVPVDKTETLNNHMEHLVVDILPLGYRKKQKENIASIHKAIEETRLLSFQYRNNRGEQITRTIEPMTLIFKGYAWYLFAWCQVRKDYRFFRVSRMEDINILTGCFERKNKSYDDVFSDDTPDEEEITIKLRFSPIMKNKVDEYFEDNQITFLDNGEIEVTMSVPEDEWIYSLILSYGEHVQVIEPPHIRTIIQKKAEKILSHYKPDILMSQQDDTVSVYYNKED